MGGKVEGRGVGGENEGGGVVWGRGSGGRGVVEGRMRDEDSIYKRSDGRGQVEI